MLRRASGRSGAATLALGLFVVLCLGQGAVCAQPQAIAVNQLGFTPAAAKRATVAAGPASRFELLAADSGRVVLAGPLSPARPWAPAGQAVRVADFSAVRAPGRYRLRVAGLPDSDPFVIRPGVYAPLSSAALRALFFNRASQALSPALAGPYARAAGHADTEVLVHPSAAGPRRHAGDRIASPGGWYDAGDYNKYVVNAAFATHLLLAAYERAPARAAGLAVGLPESGDGLPDLLHEALWSLRWLLSMQDPDDGGVYHKLSNADFDGVIMPAEADRPRWLLQKSTAAALDFAAVMAQASRVLRDLTPRSPQLPAQLLQAARAAWDWARANPRAVYRQPPDIHTGEYGDDRLDDEFAWAAAELHLATGDPAYLAAVPLKRTPMSLPSWRDVGGLAWLSLAARRERLDPAVAALARRRVLGLASQLLDKAGQASWGVALAAPDFIWGSNGVALNQALVLLQAEQLAPERAPRYRAAAQALLDYVLGRNPLGLSQVTGFGSRSPQHPHHRPSAADGVIAPVPGFLVGGANAGREDAQGCTRAYPARPAALAYLDDYCSYATNEVAINWNAALVYVSLALGED